MNGGKVIFHFEGDDSQLKKTESNAVKGVTKTGSIIKGVVGGLGLTALVGKAMSTISSSIDGAVSRVDTLNNFPKVMENMQISAEDSEKAIKKVSDGITGLPTTLDSAAAAVQRFTSVNGDVNESADIFLAVNDAIVAGGASAETQASAMEQLSQAYAKGKPDMTEWRSIQTAMPAQLKQVAIAMGYGADGVSKLGEDLRNGDVSMDDFIGTIQKLDTEGANGFKSFSDQAQSAVGGIGTSITNAKTAITRGVGEMIKSADGMLAPIGGVSGAISTLGTTFENVLSGKMNIGEAFNKLAQDFNKVLPNILNAISSLIQGLLTALPQILQTLLNTITTILIPKIVEMIPTIIPAVIKCIIELAKALVQAIPILVAQIPVIIGAIIEGILNSLPDIIMMAPELIISLITGLIKAIPMLVKNGPKIVGGIIEGIVLCFAKIVKNGMDLISKLVSGIQKGFSKIPTKVKEWVKNKILQPIKDKGISGLKDVGINLIKGLWNGIKSVTSWVYDKISGFASGILDKVKKIFGIHSPSKVMFEIGGFIDQGFINGIESMKKQVQTSFGGVFDLSPSLTGTASTNLSPNVNVNVNNNMSMDPLGRVVSDIKTFSGGAKNDYNYGMGGGV